MPELHTRTILLDIPAPAQAPLYLLDPSSPLLWWREGSWLIGRGELLTYEFGGSHRFTEAAELWERLSRHAEERGSLVDLPFPSEPLAFATFAFSDISETPSLLVVPELLLGCTKGQLWARTTDIHDSCTGLASLSDDDLERYVRGLFCEYLAAHEAEFSAASSAEHATMLTASANEEIAHERAVTRALHLIEEGKLKKVVIARRARGELSKNFSLPRVLRHLIEAYPTCQVFCVDGFFGASPETLLESHSGLLHARVLAGTRPALADVNSTRPALLEDTKEMTEHSFAVASLTDVLHEASEGVQEEGPYVLQLPNVEHLATDVYAQARSTSLLELLADIHPTAAVAGTPRSQALEAILALEDADRGRYAGPVGWIAGSDGEFAVGLRSAQIRGRVLEAWAGGGIVEGSQARREFEETEAKLAPIRSALTPGGSPV